MNKKILFILIFLSMGFKTYCQQNNELHFTAVNGPATVTLAKKLNPSLAIYIEYKTSDTAAWSLYTIGQTINLSSGSKVYFRSYVDNNRFNTSSSSGSYYYFSMTGSVYADGNIMSLIDPTMQRDTVPWYAFAKLFINCSSLVHAPDLPFAHLGNCCYSQMFSGCTSLTQPPALPADSLAIACYCRMFEGCTSLIQAPALPATSLADNCYANMFQGCTSLIQAPALPATTLANECYIYMFDGCTSLVQAPALPATNLASRCYEEMFTGCISITQAPTLPATNLANSCYNRMFYGCASLLQAPALPATVLATFCYTEMFLGCTSLTDVPALPATTLADGCYSWMFCGCSSMYINEYGPGRPWQIPCSATAQSQGYSSSMFYGTSGQFTGSPVIGQTYYIASGMSITAISNDTSMGTVTGGGGSYNCREYVTLTAISKPHHHLVNWSNGETDTTIYIYVQGDSVLTAYFDINQQHTVTVNSNDSTKGTVSGAGVFEYGATITLTAHPNDHYHLANWSNGMNDDTISVTIKSDTTFTANFEIDKHTVNVLASNSEYGVVSGGGVYDYGSTVSLTATPNDGCYFVSWSNGMITPTISISVSSDTTLTAQFETGMYSVTATANYSNRGTVTGSGQYNYNDKATLSATPNDGFVFSGWDNGETNRVIYVTVVSDTVITAIFEPVSSAVDDVVEREYIVYPSDKDIHINGAVGELVRVYDVNGKLISEIGEASEEESVTVYVAGVYFVRIDDKKPIRVIVK